MNWHELLGVMNEMEPDIPTADQCVLRRVIDRLAHDRPDDVFAYFDSDGSEWTFLETWKHARRLAAALQSLGVQQGDHVVSWLPNGPEALNVFFAINYIGAVYVPINTAYRGPLLAHVIENSDAKIMIADCSYLDRLVSIPVASLTTIVITAGASIHDIEIHGNLSVIAVEALVDDEHILQPLDREIAPWDTQSIIYTSGTTGPSKGVLSSYIHSYASMDANAWPPVRDDDRFLINMPFFHIGGTFIVNAMLCRGASITIIESFKTDTFWQTIRRSKSTAVFLLGVMASFLTKVPPSPDDKDHSLRTALIVPYDKTASGFHDRFGADVYTIFNMTEVSTPTFSAKNLRNPGVTGSVRPGVCVRLVDENDCPVPPGEIGEMVIRTDCPWALNHGYYKDPESTVRAWRNGWFHTGDAFRQNADGTYSFVDRLKDAIRRRGENISSFEVEAVVILHDDVQEAAAIPVPSEHGEDEVMIVVAPKSGHEIEPADLIDFLRPRLASFMVPRYVRVLNELPKTLTAKVQKSKLRNEGVTAATWDRSPWDPKV
ncbi:MAG: AMP-binding protein [Hyphomicrobiaceae bacterium]